MLSRELSVQQGLPSELFGLLHASFYNRLMVEPGAPDYAFYDACKVRSELNNADGHYLVCGAGTPGGSSAATVLPLSGGIPQDYLTIAPGGYAGKPLVGCCSLPVNSTPSMRIAWFIGMADGNAIRVPTLLDATIAANYALNGLVLPGGVVPEFGAPIGMSASVGSGFVLVAGQRSDNNKEFMSQKSVTDATTGAWTQVTVPGSGSTGYLKVRQSTAGWTMAIAAGQGMHISTTASVTTMIRDATHPFVDVDYSANDDLFIACDGSNAYIAPAGWGSSGPASWTHVVLPANAGVPARVVAMDVASKFSAPQERVGGPRTWYLIMTVGGTDDAACTYLTQNFTMFYSAQIPGTQAAGVGPTGQPILKFVHDRLFSFVNMGFSVSGQIGAIVNRY